MLKVFVNGTFDVLHPGHINLFQNAKSKGDFLFVAIDSDNRVSHLKGIDRPFNTQENRKYILESIKYIDKVIIFNDDDQLKYLIKDYQPDIMMVGSDWKGKNIIGSEYAKQLIFFDRDSRYSTTKILESFINRRQLHR
jgi:D-beta-D-heptose 7-phosphate kinase/D-beta-D-heptose 1-phosphate adenosyltransferase